MCAVRTLRRLKPTQSDIDSLVAEHSKSNSSPLTDAGAKAILAHSQPPSTTVLVAGDNVKGPDVIYSTGETETHLQIKSVANPRKFEAQIRREVSRPGSSSVIGVQVPVGTSADQLMGKLRNNFSDGTVLGRSVIAVDSEGKVVIPMQPFPRPGGQR